MRGRRGGCGCMRIWEGRMQPGLEFTAGVDAVVVPLIAQNPGKNPQGREKTRSCAQPHNKYSPNNMADTITETADWPCLGKTKKSFIDIWKKTDSIFTKLMLSGFFLRLLTDEFWVCLHHMLSCFPPLCIQVLTGAQRGVFSHPLTPAERFESKENVSKQRSVEKYLLKKRPQRQKTRRWCSGHTESDWVEISERDRGALQRWREREDWITPTGDGAGRGGGCVWVESEKKKTESGGS